MTAGPPATFVDVSDGPMLVVFGYLPFNDRVSLAQTCTRLRHLAINEDVLGRKEHVLSSPTSALLALSHRAQNLKANSAAALQIFLWGYSWPAQHKWPIAHLELCAKIDITLLGERVGALMPSIASLVNTGPDRTVLRIESPALVAGLTRCTELELCSDRYCYSNSGASVTPAFFAALPNLRTLSWGMPGSDSSPFRPVLGSLESLTLQHLATDAGAQLLLSQLEPHVPNLRQLTLKGLNMAGQITPPALFGLTTLVCLDLNLPTEATYLADSIGDLTRLTKLRCYGVHLASLPPSARSRSCSLWI